MAHRLSRTALACALVGALSAAQTPGPAQGPVQLGARSQLVLDEATRVADPKLAGGGARVAFHMTPGRGADVAVEVRAAGGALVRSLWSGRVAGGASRLVTWDGRDASGARCAPGEYSLRVAAPGDVVHRPLQIVRLGVTEIEAQDSPAAGLDEWQMVYFMKNTAYAFYATPATGEYVNVAPAGQISALDLDDGEPRPAVAVHAGTASPVMSGANYSTVAHNYPLAYSSGASPRLELTFGATSTTGGEQTGVGLPVAGHEIRVACEQGAAVPGSELVTAGGTALLDLAPLQSEVGREARTLVLRFEHRALAESEWHAIEGSLSIPLRFYTLLGAPQWKSGASGTQYSGPWVEVAEYVSSWKQTLGLPASTQPELTEVFVKGFFGQNGGIATAIEGVRYDAFPLGGDGGATHYHSFSGWNMNLARLLNNHASGVFVNCSDNMGAATTMLSMLGATDVRSVRLGTMDLRALWGIGAPGYTLDLWGGSHGFSYHHIITDDAAVHVSDTCMQLDVDGTPTALPSTVGWNVRRAWTGVLGYMNLAADNNVTRTVEALPGVQ